MKQSLKLQCLKSQCLKSQWKGFLFLLPSLMGICLFYILPYWTIFHYSVQNNPIQKEFVGLSNYSALMKNQAFSQAVMNTASVTVLGVFMILPLSLFFAEFLDNRKKWKLVSWVRTCMLSPMVVPAACIVMVWEALYNRQGIMNQILNAFGVESILWMQSGWSKLVMISLFLWKYIGYNMIVFEAALAEIPNDQLEVARLEGAGNWIIFLKIKLRSISPTLLFLTLLSVMNSLKIFREVYLLSGDYPDKHMYLLSHFLNNTLRTLDYQKMSAAAILFSLAMIVIIGVLFLLEQYVGKDMEK